MNVDTYDIGEEKSNTSTHNMPIDSGILAKIEFLLEKQEKFGRHIL